MPGAELLFVNEGKAPTAIFPDGYKIRQSKSGATCAASVGVTTKVYGDGAASAVLSLSYSGSETSVEIFKVDGCVALADLSFYTPKITVGPSLVEVTPGCECGDNAEASCQCDPGGVFTLDQTCAIQKDRQASLTKVKRVLGVEIAAESMVFHPGRKDAKVLGLFRPSAAP